MKKREKDRELENERDGGGGGVERERAGTTYKYQSQAKMSDFIANIYAINISAPLCVMLIDICFKLFALPSISPFHTNVNIIGSCKIEFARRFRICLLQYSTTFIE